MSDEEEAREWKLLFEEYKALREEILNKMDKQYKIGGLGTGGIAILLSFALKEGYYPLYTGRNFCGYKMCYST